MINTSMKKLKKNMAENKKFVKTDGAYYKYKSRIEGQLFLVEELDELQRQIQHEVEEMIELNKKEESPYYDGEVLISLTSQETPDSAFFSVLEKASDIIDSEGTSLQTQLQPLTNKYGTVAELAWKTEIFYRPNITNSEKNIELTQQKKETNKIPLDWINELRKFQTKKRFPQPKKGDIFEDTHYKYKIKAIYPKMLIIMEKHEDNKKIEFMDIFGEKEVERKCGPYTLYFHYSGDQLIFKRQIEKIYKPKMTPAKKEDKLIKAQWSALNLESYIDEKDENKYKISTWSMYWKTIRGPELRKYKHNEIWKWLEKIKKEKIKRVLIHEGDKEAFILLMKEMANCVYAHTTFYDDKIGQIQCMYRQHKFILMDSSALYPIPTSDFTNESKENKAKIVYEKLENFRKEVYERFSLDIFRKKTLAGLSYQIWKKVDYNDKKINIPIIHRTRDIGKLINQAYYGGILWKKEEKSKIEKIEKIDGEIYDVNSMYPAQMLNKEMPMGEIERHYHGEDWENKFGFAQAKIQANEKKILPHTDKQGTYYPTNKKFTGWYFIEELKQAKKNGYKIKVLEIINFKKKGKIFNNYVTIFNDMKIKNADNSNTRQIAKLFLNSLYGTFAKRHRPIQKSITISPQAEFKNEEAEKKLKEKTIGKTILIRDTINIIPNNTSHTTIQPNIAIAAAITAYARIYLQPYVKDENTIYVDTDSIITTKKPKNLPIHNTKLGWFKKEEKIKDAIFIKPKIYAYKKENGETVIKSSGISSKYLSYNDFKKIAENPQEKISVVRYIQVKKYQEMEIFKKEISFTLSISGRF